MKMLGFDPYSPSARAANIVLRTAHLGAMALWVGGLCFAPPGISLRTWQVSTAATGIALLLSEMSHSRHWVYLGSGLICLTHLALAGLASHGLGRGAALAALVVGAVGSHLPRTVRRWSLRHRQVME